MPPAVVYTDVDDTLKITGALFAGKKFFLTARVPQRSRYVKDIETNGGTVVKLEKQADYVIADHMRSDAPPGSISYRFIDIAIKDGQLPDPYDHPAGEPAGTIRQVGSVVPGRNTRVAYTAEDDIELYSWVKAAEARGAAIKGMELYKQLEARNPRHTAQSWRDHYLKQLAYKPPVPLPTPMTDRGTPAPEDPTTRLASASLSTTPRAPLAATAKNGPHMARRGGASSRAGRSRSAVSAKSTAEVSTPQPPTPASRPSPVAPRSQSTTQANKPLEPRLPPTAPAQSAPNNNAAFESHDLEHENILYDADGFEHSATMPGPGTEEFIDWLRGAEQIQDITVGEYHKAWIDFAKKNTEHTAEEWRAYYERVVLPLYLEKEENDDLPQGGSNRDFRDIIKVFGTQGQPVYTPSSRRSTASGTLHGTGRPRPAVGGRSVTSPISDEKITATGAAEIAVQSPSDKKQPATIKTSPKRKLAGTAHVQDEAQKRVKVEPLEDTFTQTEQPAPILQHDLITISSDGPSDAGEDEQIQGLVSSESQGDDATGTDHGTSDDDAAVQTQLQLEMQMSQGIALTADNLAQSQAQHNPRTDKRALDIAPDDESKDQGHYADYLGSLLQGPAADGQVSKDGLNALTEKHKQLQALAIDDDDENEDCDDDDENDNDDENDDEDTNITPHAIRTQDIDPNLEDSSPLRQDSPDSIQPLDPDTSPAQSPYHLRIQDIDPNIDVSSESEAGDDIELDLPEPEGGWDNLASQDEPQRQPGSQARGAPLPRDKGKGRDQDPDTQDVFGAPTQQPDLDFPDLESEGLPPAALDSQMMDQDQIQRFIDDHCSRGHPSSSVADALFWASFKPELAEIVLEAFARGQSVPNNIPGIWTEEDDEAVEGTDARRIRRLLRKHGGAEVDARIVFLEDYRAGD